MAKNMQPIAKRRALGISLPPGYAKKESNAIPASDEKEEERVCPPVDRSRRSVVQTWRSSSGCTMRRPPVCRQDR